MGTKVNIFLSSMLLYGVVMWNFNMTSLFIILSGFTILYKNFKVWRFTRKFPGRNFSSNWKTFFENSAANFHHELNEMWVKFGRDKFITWVGFERFITVSKLSDIQGVLNVTEDALFLENYQQMWPWLGGNDVTKPSEFSSRVLVDVLTAGRFFKFTQSEVFTKALNKRIEVMCQQTIKRDDIIDAQPVIRSMTFDIIYELATGREPQSQRRELFEAAEKLCQMADQRVYSGWKQNKWLFNVLGEESQVRKCLNVFTQNVKQVLNEKRDERARDQGYLLDALLTSETLSQDEIVSTLVGFIVLGYDRLSSSTCLALTELSKQSQIQEKIHREIKVNSVEAVNSLTMLDCFLQEAQRLYPATSLVTKRISQGIPLSGFFIPPNSSVILYLHEIGREAERFQNPNKFDMNRKNLCDTFGGKSYKPNLPMTIMKILLGYLIKNYRLSTDKKNAEIGSGITLRVNAVRVNFRSR